MDLLAAIRDVLANGARYDEDFARGSDAYQHLIGQEGWLGATGSMLSGAASQAGDDISNYVSELADDRHLRDLPPLVRGPVGALASSADWMMSGGPQKMSDYFFSGLERPEVAAKYSPKRRAKGEPPQQAPQPARNSVDLADILAQAGSETPMFRLGSSDVAVNSRGSFSKTPTNGRDWEAINQNMQEQRARSDDKLMAEILKAQMLSEARSSGEGDGRVRSSLIQAVGELARAGVDPVTAEKYLSRLNVASGGLLPSGDEEPMAAPPQQQEEQDSPLAGVAALALTAAIADQIFLKGKGRKTLGGLFTKGKAASGAAKVVGKPAEKAASKAKELLALPMPSKRRMKVAELAEQLASGGKNSSSPIMMGGPAEKAASKLWVPARYGGARETFSKKDLDRIQSVLDKTIPGEFRDRLLGK